jgi:hypothetical protein
MTNGNDVLEHIEKCKYCEELQEVIDFIADNISDKFVRANLIDSLFEKQLSCFTESVIRNMGVIAE